MKIYIDNTLAGKNIISYTLRVITRNKNFEVEFVSDRTGADLCIDASNDSDIPVSTQFYKRISDGIFDHRVHFKDGCYIRTETGEIDPIATIFYCINSLQEYHPGTTDSFGRFEFKNSYQSVYGNIQNNHIQEIIDQLFITHPKFSKVKTAPVKSTVFLTHDIDSVHGAIKEDGFHALKKGAIGKIFSLMKNSLSGKPDWLNMERLIALEKSYGFSSVFYWLIYNDRMNADYDFMDARIKEMFRLTASDKFENGLHKSIGKRSFTEEITKFGSLPAGNRFHYLKFSLPAAYLELEAAGIRLDTSLGYTDEMGFRNGYGLPFMPYDFAGERVIKIVEVPQLIMDRTFFKKNIAPTELSKMLIQWLETNRTNCVITINFHNNFFSEMKYRGYEKVYCDLLQWLRDNNIESVTQKQLIEQYYQPELFNNN